MACPVCLNDETSAHEFAARDRFFETTPRIFRMSACGACHCLFLEPPPNAKDLASYYPQHYWWTAPSGLLKSCESLYRRLVLRDHIASVESAASAVKLEAARPARVLDVGCGSGTLLSLLRQRGFEVCGFDTSIEAANIAKSENGLHVVTGESVKDADFAAGGFDLVTLFHVMEHTSEPRNILSEVRRILQPHGRVLVQVPNIESWQSRVCGRHWYGLDVPRHLINYSNRSIRRLLCDSGFRVHRIRHFNLRDNAAAFASSLCPGLDPVSRCARLSRRNRNESSLLAWTKHLAYAGVVAAAYPFVLAEAVCGAGGTVMLEAEKI